MSRRSLPILSVAQMRRWEKATWSSGITEGQVIANVGCAIATRLLTLTKTDEQILLFAGKGHNGDDARAAVLHLPRRNALTINVADPREALVEFRRFPRKGWILDGLFDIGLDRPLDTHWRKLINAINESGLPIVAIDTPSGLNADTGEAQGAVIQAVLTLTVGAPKRGLIGAPAVGRLETLEDIGLVPCPFQTSLLWTSESDFPDFPPRRDVNTNKGTFGHAVICAGSVGYHGAAVVSMQGALRARPGLVTIFTLPDAYLPVAAQAQAAMVHPWTPKPKIPKTASALCFGPGLAAADVPEWSKDQVRQQWKDSPLPVIVDASALGWLKPGATRKKAVRIITPHPGEAGRLLKSDAATVQKNRVAALRQLSRKFGGCIVVLKGNQTLVGTKNGPIYVNSSGNPALAQGGSGDLLSGYLTGLLAQPQLLKDSLDTVRFGVWKHGAAADHLSVAADNWTIEDLAKTL